MKKVLFITYFWVPSGKATVHWPLKITKYLPQFNWQPYVLTAEEDMFSSIDLSLLNEVDSSIKTVRTKSWDPFELYRTFIGKSKNESITSSETISKTNKSLTHRISIWIRMNLFIPDARMGWYFPGVKEGKKFFEREKFDAIVSIGPPHTGHLIGKSLSQKYSAPHIPVFIDPWVDIVYYKNFKRSRLTLAIDNHFEKSVLENSAATIFVTKTMQEDYIKKYEFLKSKSHVLYWGFDEEEFKDFININSDSEIIVHAGNIFDYQNIPAFWRKVKAEIDEGRKLKLKFIGTVGPAIRNSISEIGLDTNTEYVGFLPYKKMLQELQSASFLLVCPSEKRHVPGKLFEYLRTGKPIIAFADDNEEVKNILREANAGMVFKYSEDAKEMLDGDKNFKTNLNNLKKFDRKEIAKDLSKILQK